jgi:hypothetical protein
MQVVIYLCAILVLALDLFIWRPDTNVLLETNQLRPEHRRGYGELKALAIQRSDEAFRQRHMGHPSLKHRRAYQQVEEACNSYTPRLTRRQYRACIRSFRLDGRVRR